MKYNTINIFVFMALSLLLLDCGGSKVGKIVSMQNYTPTIDPGEVVSTDNPNIKKCKEGVTHCSTEQLCTGRIGSGRKIYVINGYDGGSFSESLKTDLTEIKEYTGISFDIHEGLGFNSEDLDALSNTEYDAIWVLGGMVTINNSDLLSAIEHKVQQGVGIVLLGEHDKYSTYVDDILKNIKPDWNLKFETLLYDTGKQLVSKENTGSKVLYDHPVTSGLYKNLSEGDSISYLLPRDTSKISIMDKSDLFKPIILNSSSHTSVAAVEEELSQGISGYSKARKNNGKILQRTLMHGNFSSLCRDLGTSWDWGGKKSSTAHFFYNIACWSAGTY